MFSITLTGDEQPRFIRAMAAALNVIAEQLTGLPAAPATPAAENGPSTSMPPAPEQTPEAPKVTKSQAKRLKAQQESPDTATADQSAVIAEAKAQIAAEQAASQNQGKAADPLAPESIKHEDGKPAPEVTVEQLREVAAKLNTDTLRDKALAILQKHGAKSVTELGERDNIVRVSAMNDFIAAAQA